MQVIDKDADYLRTIGLSPKLRNLNRFTNITVCKSLMGTLFNGHCIASLSDDDNRVKLMPIEGHSDCQREFINACYVDVR